jgi:hypothetical protein
MEADEDTVAPNGVAPWTAEHRSAATDGFYRPEFGLKRASGDRLRLVGSLLPQFQSGTQEGMACVAPAASPGFLIS